MRNKKWQRRTKKANAFSRACFVDRSVVCLYERSFEGFETFSVFTKVRVARAHSRAQSLLLLKKLKQAITSFLHFLELRVELSSP